MREKVRACYSYVQARVYEAIYRRIEGVSQSFVPSPYSLLALLEHTKYLHQRS